MTKFAILASGRGSNAEALMKAFAADEIPGAELALVLSNQADAPVLDKAKAHGIEGGLVESRNKERYDHELELLEALGHRHVDHLLLAGYMRVLSPTFLRGWRGQILNIHPSLLPEFPGLRAPERQWEAGVRVSGATVHYVDSGVDTGPVLLQGSLDVRGDEGPEGLADRIREEIEHVIYPRAVRLFLERLDRQNAKSEEH